MALVPGSLFMRGDFTTEATQLDLHRLLNLEQWDCLLCDIPANPGSSLDLEWADTAIINGQTIRLAEQLIKPGGTVLMRTCRGVLEE